MKTKYLIIWMIALIGLSSCDDYLDVNKNPNNPTSVEIELILPQAIVATAGVTEFFNTYGSHLVGYRANAGGFSGFGILITYDISPGTYDNLWVTTYQSPLQDFKLVIDGSEGSDKLAYFNAAAKIMTVYNYQRLVDAFGDIPYSQALKGIGNLTPAYDDAATVYQELVKKLDEAIDVIDNATFPAPLNASTDPLFKGDMDNWKRFANTIKLRMLVRISGVTALSAYVTSEFGSLDTSIGFLTSDAQVNPGYARTQPNSLWATWGYNTSGALGTAAAWIPTKFVYGFYNGAKIQDDARGSVIYKNFPNTPTNQLGDEVGSPTIITNYSSWYTGTYNSSSSITDALGILKGPSMGRPLMLAAESHFLQSEAYLKGLLPGSYTTSYDNGIKASMNYLFRDVNGALGAGKDVNAAFAGYMSDNSTNRLVDISLAGSDEERLEAIITQKYIALNFINSDEAWNEFRRTGYPLTMPLANPEQDMASIKSNSTRADRLITRAKYPSSEQAYNASNFRDINHFVDRIFWDPN